jgi:hypothetical protein
MQKHLLYLLTDKFFTFNTTFIQMTKPYIPGCIFYGKLFFRVFSPSASGRVVNYGSIFFDFYFFCNLRLSESFSNH